jgi:hypothetical protein
MDREMKALIKSSKNTNQSKYKQLQRGFNEYVKKNEVKVSTINDLRKENKELKAKLEYEQYIYSEELGWSNDVVQLLIQCEPIVKSVDVELHKQIKQVINAISV